MGLAFSACSTALLGCSCISSVTNCVTAGAHGEKVARGMLIAGLKHSLFKTIENVKKKLFSPFNSRYSIIFCHSCEVFYLFFMVMSVAAALIMKNYGNDLVMDIQGVTLGCVNGTTSVPFTDKLSSVACAGNEVVYRFSGSLFLFYIICGAFSLCGRAFHQGMWGLKALVYFVLTIGSFFVNNEFFNTYANIARYLSFFFLVMQVVALIDFAYNWHESWVNKAQDEDEMNGTEAGLFSNKWRALYVIFGFGMFILSIIGGLYMYNAFNCGLLYFLISMSVVGTMVIGGLSVCTQLSTGLLPGSVVCVYTMYLCWSALASYPYTECNPGLNDPKKYTAIVGLLISAFTLSYSAFSLAGKPDTFLGDRSGDVEGGVMLLASDDSDGDMDDDNNVAIHARPANNTVKPEMHDDMRSTSKGRFFFHFIMAVGSAYVAMLLTSWAADAGLDTDLGSNVGVGLESMWVKIVSQWTTFTVYVWTVFAPLLFPDREFY